MEGVVTVTPAAATAQPGVVGTPQSQEESNNSALLWDPCPPYSLVPEAQDQLGNSCSYTGTPGPPSTAHQAGRISNEMDVPFGGSHVRDSDWAEAWPVTLRLILPS